MPPTSGRTEPVASTKFGTTRRSEGQFPNDHHARNVLTSILTFVLPSTFKEALLGQRREARAGNYRLCRSVAAFLQWKEGEPMRKPRNLIAVDVHTDDVGDYNVTEPGWYAVDDGGKVVLGPFESLALCERAIRDWRRMRRVEPEVPR